MVTVHMSIFVCCQLTSIVLTLSMIAGLCRGNSRKGNCGNMKGFVTRSNHSISCGLTSKTKKNSKLLHEIFTREYFTV